MRPMINEAITRIREHLQKPGVTKRDVALAAGLHPNTLIGMERDDWNPSANTLIALEAAISRPESEAA